MISVADGGTPAGPFEFLDFARTADGRIPDAGRWLEPAILCEDSENYLYYGSCFPSVGDAPFKGVMMVKLADDMHQEEVELQYSSAQQKGFSVE